MPQKLANYLYLYATFLALSLIGYIMLSLLEKYQRWLVPIAIFALLLSISFSFKGSQTTWIWNKMPFVPLTLVAIALIAARVWVMIEQQKQQAKINQIQKHLMDLAPSPRQNALAKLSAREIEVLLKIAQGKTNQQIANELFVELSTIKTHINNAYKILGINNRKDAIKALNDAQK